MSYDNPSNNRPSTAQPQPPPAPPPPFWHPTATFSSSSPTDDILGQGALVQVLQQACDKLLYLCRYGQLPPPTEELTPENWHGWLLWKRGNENATMSGANANRTPPPPPPKGNGRPKSTRSVLLLGIEQYAAVQRATFVDETITHLTQALSSSSGIVPEQQRAHSVLRTHNAVTGLAEERAHQLGHAPGYHNSQQQQQQQHQYQHPMDDQSLLYLQQMLVTQGQCAMAPTQAALAQQLVHPALSRRAAQFLVRLYKLRKVLQRALKLQRVATHDAIVLQANVLLEEYLIGMTSPVEGELEDSSDANLGRLGSAALQHADASRRARVVQHVLGLHLADLCQGKQCLMLQVQGRVRVDPVDHGRNRGSSSNNCCFWFFCGACGCCGDSSSSSGGATEVIATAAVHVHFLLDMTRHPESTASQYGASFVLQSTPQRISTGVTSPTMTAPATSMYNGWNFMAHRALWDASRENVDTPLAASAPLQTDPDMLGEIQRLSGHRPTPATTHTTGTSATTTTGKKKKVTTTTTATRKKGTKSTGASSSEDDTGAARTKKSKSESTSGHSVLSMESASGARQGTPTADQHRTATTQSPAPPAKKALSTSRRASAGPSTAGGGTTQRRASTELKSSSHAGAAIPKTSRRASGGPTQGTSAATASSNKPLRKPSGGNTLTLEFDDSVQPSDPGSFRRKSGDTAPSFYDFSVEDSPKDAGKQKVRGDDNAPGQSQLAKTSSHRPLTSQIIPEIEKLGKLGEEVAAILRSPSKHTRSDNSKSSSGNLSKSRQGDEDTVATSDSQPITLRPKPPPVADSSVEASVGDSVLVFQPPGDKISSQSFRASDWSKPAITPSTPTTAAFSQGTSSTRMVGSASSAASLTKKSQTPPTSRLRRPSAENTGRPQSAPSSGRASDPPAFRSPSQREQIERKKQEQEAMNQSMNRSTASSKSPRKSNKKDAV